MRKLIYLLILLAISKHSHCQLIFSGTSSNNNNNFNNVNPFIVNSPCICVVSGFCNRANGSINPLPSDGSGVIDIRIVNSGIGGSTTGVISTTPATTGISTIIASQTSCQFGFELCCLTNGFQCGLRFPPMQGAPSTTTGQAPYGSYPWFALIFQQFTNIYVGSGVLIDHMHVLTVAHRVFNYSSVPSSLKVRMGEWNIGSTSQPVNPLEFGVIRIFTHSQYNSQSLANSIAILRVSPNVPLGQTPTITTGCLSTNLITSGRCWIAGYGQNAFVSGSTTNILQHIDLPIVDQPTCQNLLRATRLGSGFVLDTFSFMCAGGQTGRDACTGDGGSGLMCWVNNQWYVAGLVAWGIGCGAQNVPGVYINVTNYLSWIQSTTILA